MALLSKTEVEERLAALPDWRRVDDTVERTFTFVDFGAAMAFVNQVARLAEEQNHHPDIDIRWNKVRLVLSSHDAGGLTSRDFKLAASIDPLG